MQLQKHSFYIVLCTHVNRILTECIYRDLFLLLKTSAFFFYCTIETIMLFSFYLPFMPLFWHTEYARNTILIVKEDSQKCSHPPHQRIDQSVTKAPVFVTLCFSGTLDLTLHSREKHRFQKPLPPPFSVFSSPLRCNSYAFTSQ